MTAVFAFRDVSADVRRSPGRLHGTSLAVVDRHRLVAEALASGLRGLDAHVTVLTPSATLTDEVRALQPRVVLIDPDLGDGAESALPFIRSIHELGTDVMVVTGVTDRVRLAECVEAGAAGIVAKSSSFEGLADDVVQLVDGAAIMSRRQREGMVALLRRSRVDERERYAPFEQLTVRESEVLMALLDGHPAEAIAEAGFVSVATVRSHIRSILQKLGVNSQLAAVAMARRAGWVYGATQPAGNTIHQSW